MKIALVVMALLAASSAQAQYRNYEVQPDGTGGYYGTYGNQNFEVRPEPGVSGNINGRRPGVIQQRVIRRPGARHLTNRNCVVDSYGNAICR